MTPALPPGIAETSLSSYALKLPIFIRALLHLYLGIHLFIFISDIERPFQQHLLYYVRHCSKSSTVDRHYHTLLSCRRPT